MADLTVGCPEGLAFGLRVRDMMGEGLAAEWSLWWGSLMDRAATARGLAALQQVSAINELLPADHLLAGTVAPFADEALAWARVWREEAARAMVRADRGSPLVLTAAIDAGLATSRGRRRFERRAQGTLAGDLAIAVVPGEGRWATVTLAGGIVASLGIACDGGGVRAWFADPRLRLDPLPDWVT